MKWHVIAQVGADDYQPEIPQEEPRFTATIDKPGSEHSVTQHLLSGVFKEGLIPPEVAIDLIHLASMVFTADLRVSRDYGEENWTREISLHFPVADPDLWNVSTPILTELLSFLTGDEWTVVFRKKVPQKEIEAGESPLSRPDAVCLFSGGLDSFIGAIDLLATGANIAMVGHYGSKRDQAAVFDALKPQYESNMLPLWFHLMPPRMHKDQLVENTMRARSLLFLSLGAVVASAIAPGVKLYVPENGFISLNIPLTYGRAGTHSTRTTHPHTINLFRQLVIALGLDVPLVTPYRFLTKGEMLRDCKDQSALKAGVHATMSCSSPQAGRFHHRPVGQHCGYCVPCIIRRASLHAVALDCEPHHADVRDPSIAANSAAGADKRAFLMAISRVQKMTPLQVTTELLSAGPVDHNEIDGLVALFRRGLTEVEVFLKSQR